MATRCWRRTVPGTLWRSPAGTLASIDLLLTDVLMPELSGPELAESLCRERPDMQTLYTSGYAPDAIAQHGILQPDAFISKPLDRSRLAHKVREVLDSAGRSRIS